MACFDYIKYKVTLDKQNGSGGDSSATATYGNPLPTIATPSRIGCNFTGYYDQPNGAGTKYYTADGTSAHNWDKLTDATLYANWTYTVTLDEQGGSGGTSSVTATYGSAMLTPITLPSRTGYDFAGYYDQKNGAGTQYYDKNGNSVHIWDKLDKATLYANWIGKPYTVTLDKQGGSGGTDFTNATYSSEMPTPITLPDKTGYDFAGYYDQKNGAGTQYYDKDGKSVHIWNISSNATLYAAWSTKTITITYKGNGGAPPSQTLNEKYGKPYPDPTQPSWTGHDFVGWFTQIEGGVQVTPGETQITIATNHSVYAHWKTNTYTITYHGNGGTPVSQPLSATLNFPYPEPTEPMWAGHTFIGWFTQQEGGDQIYPGETPMTRTIGHSIYAQWMVNDYIVTFDKQGGTNGTSSVMATYGEPMIEITKPSRTGYDFDGYYAEKNGGGTQYYDKDGKSAHNWDIATNTNLYAYWSAKLIEITLRKGVGIETIYISRDGTDYFDYDSSDKPKVSFGNTFCAYGITKAGYSSVYTKENPYIRKVDSEYIEVTLPATPNSYTATFDMQGGSNGTDSVKATYAAAMPTPITLPSKAGYSFVGYFDKENGVGTQYYKADGTSAHYWDKTSNATLYANWSTNTYTIVFNGNHNRAVGTMHDMSNCFCDVSYLLPSNDFRLNHAYFLGWATNSASTTVDFANEASVVNLSLVNNDTVTLYAIWNEQKSIYSEALDCSNLFFERLFENPWEIDATQHHCNTTSLHHVSTGSSNKASVSAEISESGKLSFWWMGEVVGSGAFCTRAELVVKIGTNETADTYTYTALSSNVWTNVVIQVELAPGETSWISFEHRNNLARGCWVDHVIWTPNSSRQYTIVFDGNHYRAAGVMDDLENCEPNVSYQLPTNQFACPAADFLGWATNSTATIPDFTNCASVVNLSQEAGDIVTLYAVWAFPTDNLTLAAHAVNVKLETEDFPWAACTAKYGGRGIRSRGSLEESECSMAIAQLSGSGILSFYWHLTDSSESENFKFRLGADTFPGPTGTAWTFARYNVGDGNVTASWVANGEVAGSLYLDDVRWIPFQETEYDWARTYHPKGASATDAECNTFLHNNWSKYVAGCDPTDSNSVFRVKSFTLTNGVVNLEWEPDLSDYTPPRDYLIFGKTNITDAAWHSPTNSESRFFKVEVEMR